VGERFTLDKAMAVYKPFGSGLDSEAVPRTCLEMITRPEGRRLEIKEPSQRDSSTGKQGEGERVRGSRK
jgi:hypothetical protein